MLPGASRKNIGLWVLLSLILLAAFLGDLLLGSVMIPLDFIWDPGQYPDASGAWSYILYAFRLPKAITALLAGAALATAGLIMQTLFRNPLAGPYVLGISSGGSLGVSLVMMLGLQQSFHWIDASWLTVVFAIMGTLLVLLLMLGVSWKINDHVALLIIGLMLGNMTSAFVAILQFFSDPESIQKYLFWTFGSLQGVDQAKLEILLPICLLGLVASMFMIKGLDLLQLGDRDARSLGLDVKKTRILLIVITGILAGSVTAFCGPVAFIGISVPHLARMLFQRPNHRILLGSSMFIGAISLLLCDMIAQLPGSDYTLPLNAITSLVGSPVVIYVIVRYRKQGLGL